MSDFAAVIMAAGLGTRMKSATPKHLHPLLGRRLVDWVVAAVEPLGADPLVLVVAPDAVDAFGGANVAVQEKPLGTGDSLRAAREKVGAAKQVLVVSGDHPRLSPGLLQQIVENADADEAQRAIREVNSSIYVFEADKLWPALERIEPVNAQGELYLTDAVRLLVDGGEEVAVFKAPDADEVEGVNTRAELADAASFLRARVNKEHMLAGVTIVDPQTTWIEPEVELEADSTIHPFTILRGKTRVAAGAEVGPHVVALDAEIGPDVTVGPFAYLRPGTKLAAGSKAGTFVEIKNSDVGERAKIPHLSYIGDAEIGEGSNVAAGNITANFPHQEGRSKGRTRIGRNVRTGIHNGFQAPVEIGDDAWIAGGAYITEDVPPESLAGFPPKQITKEGYLRGKRND
jgi:bifunctional UDP-N-acetylglucosamine pyrophosphorylase/glucosamine-1-phosphate N-acetyltransferase